MADLLALALGVLVVAALAVAASYREGRRVGYANGLREGRRRERLRQTQRAAYESRNIP